ncbi:hypothetical protein [Ferrovibrio sp.]|uniref:hypothetical protein n=1 Tax=Ferrovibrio sp. TaxID=1917215 RepID=UPI00260657F1|nr:hypothetical protein [Ferrovibrio sp.]
MIIDKIEDYAAMLTNLSHTADEASFDVNRVSVDELRVSIREVSIPNSPEVVPTRPLLLIRPIRLSSVRNRP